MEGNDSDLNRRSTLKVIGTAMAVPTFGVGSAAARRRRAGHGELSNFDPEDKSEVKAAAKAYLEIQNERRAEAVTRSWSEKQATAVMGAIERNSEVHIDVDESQQLGLQAQSSGNDISWNYRLKSFGNTVAELEQMVYWEWEGDEVTSVEQVSNPRTPGVFWSHSGTITDDTVPMGDEGRATLVEQFQHCVTRLGCTITSELGGTIWVRAGGGWTVNS